MANKASSVTYEDLNNAVREYLNPHECDAIHKAYLYAQTAHSGQMRKSGEPYIIHPLNVALILAEQKLPTNVIIAGLLHDVVEDTNITLDEISELFGDDIANIVEGVTKLDNMPTLSSEQLIAENQRKVIVASAKDVRVIIVKLADRLHNMQTISFMNENKQKRIAKETLDIYAPIAHRLGMYKIKWELEDLSFKIINKPAYNEIAEKIDMKRSERDAFVEKVTNEVKSLLEIEGLEAKVYGRTKHIYSIYQSMKKKHKAFEELNDLFGFRIVVKELNDCYRVLGLIHNNFKPIPLSFKDYIPTPKHNMYQSIHTTVYYGNKDDGRRIEFQIRTKEMDQMAEYGVASHWMYKENLDDESPQNNVDLQLQNFRQVVDALSDSKSEKFVESLKNDFFGQSIIVYTPKGDVVELPEGSCALDFAFYIHTKVGLNALHAQVNGSYVSLYYQLHMGDVVNIITSDIAEPEVDSLTRVKTHRAKDSLRKYFNDVERADLQVQGMNILVQLGHELAIQELVDRDNNEFIQSLASKYGIFDVDQFLYELGIGEIKLSKLKQILLSNDINDEIINNIIIEDVEYESYQLCRKCNPIPGDTICACEYGLNDHYIIHREGCHQILNNSHQAAWTSLAKNDEYRLTLRIILEDQPRALASVLDNIANLGFNVIKSLFKCDIDETQAIGEITILVHNKDEVEEIKTVLRKNKNVMEVVRKLYEDNQKIHSGAIEN